MPDCNKIKMIKKGDKDFPWFLANMPDAPERLYYIGDIKLLNKPAVAVVGARKCSDYGKQAAVRIGEMLAANNLVTVSGMARGIDGYAHQGALNRDGKTIAVLGCGPDICYPKQNKKLYDNICRRGLVLSEYPPGTQAQPYMFPRRNRIISGLAAAVVVVEAGLKSGSLITAVFAATQGKEVFALPGNINSSFSVGTNKLIQDGATIITDMSDILAALPAAPTLPPRMTTGPLNDLGPDELAIYNELEQKGPLTCDHLCAILGKAPAFISGILTAMEIKGHISYRNGKIYIAKF